MSRAGKKFNLAKLLKEARDNRMATLIQDGFRFQVVEQLRKRQEMITEIVVYERTILRFRNKVTKQRRFSFKIVSSSPRCNRLQG